jgi:hypothetical protein
MSGKRLHIQSQPYQAQPSALQNSQPYDSQSETSCPPEDVQFVIPIVHFNSYICESEVFSFCS